MTCRCTCRCDRCRLRHRLRWVNLPARQAELLTTIAIKPLSHEGLRRQGYGATTLKALTTGEALVRVLSISGGSRYYSLTPFGRAIYEEGQWYEGETPP